MPGCRDVARRAAAGRCQWRVVILWAGRKAEVREWKAMAIGFQVTFDANDPEALGEFWALALGYVRQPPPPGFDNWPDALRTFGFSEEEISGGIANALVDPQGKGPRIFLRKVPEGTCCEGVTSCPPRFDGAAKAATGERGEARGAEESWCAAGPRATDALRGRQLAQLLGTHVVVDPGRR